MHQVVRQKRNRKLVFQEKSRRFYKPSQAGVEVKRIGRICEGTG